MTPNDPVVTPERHGPLAFLPVAATEEQREICRKSGFYDLGDCLLGWVNEGDLCDLAMQAASPPSNLSTILSDLATARELLALHDHGTACIDRVEEAVMKLAAMPASPTGDEDERVRTAIARELDRDTLTPFDRLDNAARAAIAAMPKASGVVGDAAFLRYWPAPWLVKKPAGEEMVQMLDAHDRTIMRLEWPFHGDDDADDAEQATYLLAEAVGSVIPYSSQPGVEIAREALERIEVDACLAHRTKRGSDDALDTIARTARNALTKLEGGQ